MSAKRSEHTKMLKRFDAQVQRYTSQIARQKRIIDKLLAANVAYSDGLDAVIESKNVREARTAASKAITMGKDILAVPNDAEENNA